MKTQQIFSLIYYSNTTIEVQNIVVVKESDCRPLY